ncbi:MAG: class I SAM-dependent methyltransferase [Parachlamydiales bacterium]|jgi:hypothetical protein
MSCVVLDDWCRKNKLNQVDLLYENIYIFFQFILEAWMKFFICNVFVFLATCSFSIGQSDLFTFFEQGKKLTRYEFVRSLIKPGDIGAEIGVCYGKFSYGALLPVQPLKLYLIDPWEYGLRTNVETDPKTPARQKIRDEDYEKVCKLFEPYKNVEIIRLKSEDAVHMFEDNYFDYVYVDGAHTYAAVMLDLNNYFYKIKIGGVLIGDDYAGDWPEVIQAVDNFLKEHRGEYELVAPLGMSRQYALKRLK